jgi:FkbM family methyltransferase
MGLNYLIGSSLSKARDAVLRARPPVFFNRFPRGRIMEADLLRVLADEPQVIFDVGANVGQTANRFSRWFPKATIHSFEPVAANLSKLQAATRSLPNVKVHPCACGSVAGTFAINLGEDSERHSLAPREGARSVNVDVTTIDGFCQLERIERIDLLKSDTEGFETHVLTGAKEMLASGAIRSVYVEVGLNGQAIHTPFADVLALLKPAGFQFSGFYEPFRCGDRKEVVWLSNALFVRV